MSTQKGNIKKAGQKYQNKFKFKHNENSKETAKIIKSPLDRLCQRCFDQLQWKIDYRKYKPLTSYAKCTDCGEKNILKAYRNLCDECASRRHDVPVAREGLSMSTLLANITEGQELPEEIKEQFEVKSMMRCSKCCIDVESYAVKVLTDKEIEIDEL